MAKGFQPSFSVKEHGFLQRSSNTGNSSHLYHTIGVDERITQCVFDR
jgi:hypothetical protein